MQAPLQGQQPGQSLLRKAPPLPVLRLRLVPHQMPQMDRALRRQRPALRQRRRTTFVPPALTPRSSRWLGARVFKGLRTRTANNETSGLDGDQSFVCLGYR